MLCKAERPATRCSLAACTRQAAFDARLVGQVHRDIKCGNVLLTESGQVRMMAALQHASCARLIRSVAGCRHCAAALLALAPAKCLA